MEKLSRDSGYSCNFLVDRYHEMVNDPDVECDWNYFVGVSMEHDW